LEVYLEICSPKRPFLHFGYKEKSAKYFPEVVSSSMFSALSWLLTALGENDLGNTKGG
jgi:hypothetical protein